jgi:CopG family nickel-responsive transcriptional regulator
MSKLVRFGVSIEDELLQRFDREIEKKGYSNRSEAIRDLIRDQIVTEEWTSDQETVGTITIVYDHHTRDLSGNLTHIQHSFEGEIKSVLHIHLDHHNCLEVLVVAGKARLLQQFADQLVSIKGVKHGKLTMATTGAAIPTKGAHHPHDPASPHSHD